MLTVKLKKERNSFKKPILATEGSACYDVYAAKIEKLDDGMVICYLGFSTEIPSYWKGVIVSRSNITKYGWVLANGIGIIDSDYRSEWQVRFRPLCPVSDKPITAIVGNDNIEEVGKIISFGNYIPNFPYKEGERVAQVYFEPINGINFIEVEETTDTDRGVGGFGHTGVK